MNNAVPYASTSSSPLVENFDASPFYQPDTAIRTLHFSNGDVYQGETLGDLRHGQGKHVCTNGDVHEGSWYKGMRHGHGLATFVRGFSYSGDFEYDRADGFGKAKYENGSVYEGDFKSDQRSGWGVQIFPDESVYVGEWAEDKMTGRGRHTYKDGSFYEGTWKDGERVKGKWISADKREEYHGEWKGDQRHGSGTCHIHGLCQFTGEWQNGLQHGAGKCRWVDGSAYDGQWANGSRNGQGVMVRADGYKYDGAWKDDREHGTGNARLCNGDRYSGDFSNGEPHGQGRMHTAAGDRYEGQWSEGKRHGQGRCIFENGDKYQGEWVCGKRQGEGTCKFGDGTLFHGLWQEDQWFQTDAEPSISRVMGAGLGAAVAGQDASFTILAKDELGNKRLVGGDTFAVWLEGPATVHASVADNGEGTYKATYNATVAGIYDLYITNDTGESVAESPYPLRVVAGSPDPRKSMIQVEECSSAKVGQFAEFKLVARDSYSNRCIDADLLADLPIECEMSCGGTSCSVTIVPSTAGCYVGRFTATAPGYHRVFVTSRGKPLSNSPASVKVEGSGDVKTAKKFVDQKLVNKVLEWERRAAEQYAEDGDADGWASDASEPETAEQRYIREHPDVPVVENLEDMWKVTKLQRERKAKQDGEQAMRELQQLKQEQAGRKVEPPLPLEGDGFTSDLKTLTNKLRQTSLEAQVDESNMSTDTHGSLPG